MATIEYLPLFQHALAHAERTALIAAEGQFTYQQLLDRAQRAAATLLEGRADLQEARIAFLIPPGIDYVATQWGTWLAGGLAVPLCVSHPPPELAYVIDDAQAEVVVCHPQFESRLRQLAAERGLRFVLTSALYEAAPLALPTIVADRRALMVYTSGTTGKPKGVVTTHRNIAAQVESLVLAWEWTADDHILHVLPLHHVHGIVNALTCALWSGATCEMLLRFDAEEVWARFVESPVTLFMAVPTIYVKLIRAWEQAPGETRKKWSAACRKMRLMISGSAALPVSVLEQWRAISGHTLLERYGMTEIGMALSNPLHGERRAGYVGAPLPGVQVRLVDENGIAVVEGEQGEIQIKGKNVFLEYWQRPEASAKAFRDGWFCSGDMAVIDNGSFRILGRQSVDIIKTGGYKISALEIEEILRTHPAIQECAVVGVPDAEWGECVAAAIIMASEETITMEQLRSWCKERLATYKTPSRLIVVEELPRNAMGKVIKPEVVKLFCQ